MTAFAPILRFIVYAGETGSAALQAPATAPHTDFFQVASRTGISGFQPYLYAEPQIDGQSLSLPEFATTVGSAKIQIGDFRISPISQFDRWATAFLGRSTDENLLVGKRCYLEVSYDAGTTYSAVYAGRVARAEMQDIILSIEVRDVGLDLKQQVFTGLDPSLSYAAQSTLYPLGLARSLPRSGFTQPTAVSASITDTISPIQRQTMADDGTSFFSSTNRGFEITTNGTTYISDDQLKELQDAIAQSTTYYASSTNGDRGGIYSNALAYVVNQTRGTSGWLTVLEATSKPISNNGDKLNLITKIKTQILPATFSQIGPVTVAMLWAKTDKVTLYIQKFGAPSDANPMFINPPNLETFLRDIVSGRFNFSPTAGTKSLYLQTGSASYTDITGALHPFNLHFKVTKADTLDNFLRESLAKPLQVGYRSDIDAVNGVSGSVITYFRLGRPSTVPTTILDESDIVAGSDPSWLNDPAYSQVVVTRYYDYQPPFGALVTVPTRDIGYSQAGASLAGGVLNVDGNALRYTPDKTQSGSIEQFSKSLLNGFTELYGKGKLTVRLSVRRSAKTIPLRVGSWVLVDSVVIPNPSTQRRGGQRLMQITNISPTLGTFSLELLDAGLSSAVAMPTFVTASYTASIPNGLVAQWSASTNVELNYAVHPVGVSTMPANSNLWQYGGTSLTGSQKAAMVSPLLAGSTVSVRIRGVSAKNSVLELPSAWLTASVATLPALSPVSSLSVSGITLGQAIFSWQTASALPVELLVNSPSGLPFTQSLVTLPGGSTRYVMGGVETYPNTSMGIGVRHTDAVGSTSAIVSSSWTATGTATALPSMSFVYTYVG